MKSLFSPDREPGIRPGTVFNLNNSVFTDLAERPDRLFQTDPARFAGGAVEGAAAASRAEETADEGNGRRGILDHFWNFAHAHRTRGH